VRFDRAASLVAKDAVSIVKMFDAVRRKMGCPELRCVLLIGSSQKMCAKTDTPARARNVLAAAKISVYRLEE